MEEFRKSHCGTVISLINVPIEGLSTYSIFKNLKGTSKTSEHNIVAQTLRSQDFFALHGIGWSFLHISVDIESVVFEAPFIDDDVGSQDGILDVLDETDSDVSEIRDEEEDSTYRTWDNMTAVGFSVLMLSIGLKRSILQIPLTTGSIFLA